MQIESVLWHILGVNISHIQYDLIPCLIVKFGAEIDL
jgi:hypothetical protein